MRYILDCLFKFHYLRLSLPNNNSRETEQYHMCKEGVTALNKPVTNSSGNMDPKNPVASTAAVSHRVSHGMPRGGKLSNGVLDLNSVMDPKESH